MCVCVLLPVVWGGLTTTDDEVPYGCSAAQLGPLTMRFPIILSSSLLILRGIPWSIEARAAAGRDILYGLGGRIRVDPEVREGRRGWALAESLS